MRFIHVSDLHMMRAGATLYGIDPAQRLRACIRDINRFVGTPEEPAFCVFTGDLVESGDPEAYRHLKQLLVELQLPHYLMLGNHDSRAAFFHVFSKYQPDANGFLQYSVATNAGVFIFMDTLNQGEPGGILCEMRLDWLRQQLARHAEHPVYLFMHHPVVDLHMPCLDRVALQNPQCLIDCIAPYNVRHLFFGHVHRAVSGQWHGIGLTGVPSCVHQIGSDFLSTNVMRYEHGPPAYAFVDLSADAVLTQLQHFLPEHQNPGFDIGEPVNA